MARVHVHPPGGLHHAPLCCHCFALCSVLPIALPTARGLAHSGCSRAALLCNTTCMCSFPMQPHAPAKAPATRGCTYRHRHMYIYMQPHNQGDTLQMHSACGTRSSCLEGHSVVNVHAHMHACTHAHMHTYTHALGQVEWFGGAVSLSSHAHMYMYMHTGRVTWRGSATTTGMYRCT